MPKTPPQRDAFTDPDVKHPLAQLLSSYLNYSVTLNDLKIICYYLRPLLYCWMQRRGIIYYTSLSTSNTKGH